MQIQQNIWGLYEECFKTLMGEFKDLNKWRTITCSVIEWLGVVKLSGAIVTLYWDKQTNAS